MQKAISMSHGAEAGFDTRSQATSKALIRCKALSAVFGMAALSNRCEWRGKPFACSLGGLPSHLRTEEAIHTIDRASRWISTGYHTDAITDSASIRNKPLRFNHAKLAG